MMTKAMTTTITTMTIVTNIININTNRSTITVTIITTITIALPSQRSKAINDQTIFFFLFGSTPPCFVIQSLANEFRSHAQWMTKPLCMRSLPEAMLTFYRRDPKTIAKILTLFLLVNTFTRRREIHRITIDGIVRCTYLTIA